MVFQRVINEPLVEHQKHYLPVLADIGKRHNTNVLGTMDDSGRVILGALGMRPPCS